MRKLSNKFYNFKQTTMKQVSQKKPSSQEKKKKVIVSDYSSDDGSSHVGVTPIYVNGVEIDIETITDAQLLELRKVLPRK